LWIWAAGKLVCDGNWRLVRYYLRHHHQMLLETETEHQNLKSRGAAGHLFSHCVLIEGGVNQVGLGYETRAGSVARPSSQDENVTNVLKASINVRNLVRLQSGQLAGYRGN
jgi:hypothetical protein